MSGQPNLGVQPKSCTPNENGNVVSAASSSDSAISETTPNITLPNTSKLNVESTIENALNIPMIDDSTFSSDSSDEDTFKISESSESKSISDSRSTKMSKVDDIHDSTRSFSSPTTEMESLTLDTFAKDVEPEDDDVIQPDGCSSDAEISNHSYDESPPPEKQTPVKERKDRSTASVASRIRTTISSWGRKKSTDDDNLSSSVIPIPEERYFKTMLRRGKKEPPQLSLESRAILKESWGILQEDINVVGVELFTGMFDTHPDAVDSFMPFKEYRRDSQLHTSIIKAHSLRVLQTVDKCVYRLDNPKKMLDILNSLGERHVDYGAIPSFIPLIGEHFLGAIRPKLGDKWNRQVNDAWVELFVLINHHFYGGMRNGMKRHDQ